MVSRPTARRRAVGSVVSLTLGLILMLGAGALIGLWKFGGGLPAFLGGDGAEPTDAALAPAPPESPADLLAYVMAGTAADPAPYELPGNSEPVYGFHTQGEAIECLLDPFMDLLVCTIAEPSWPAAQRPSGCDAQQTWMAEAVVYSQATVSRGNCYSGTAPPKQASTLLDDGLSIAVPGFFTCRSESWYLACVNESLGNTGFVMGHDFYKLIGTVAP